MKTVLLIIALLLGVALGWIWARWGRAHTKPSLAKPYLEGLNYLLNEQPDQAMDIFIKLLAADDANVETHFALGQLFRRRGEVDRAIRIHQHILARPQLNKAHRQQALLALGKDYLHAGVFDRAERIFQELANSDNYRVESLQRLLHIYEQEHEWERAITTAELLMKLTPEPITIRMAHYYCELAQLPMHKGNSQQQMTLLKKALHINKNCARAALFMGHLSCEQKIYKQAIKYYLRLEEQNSLFLLEAYQGLLSAYTALGQTEKFYQLLMQHLQRQPQSITMMHLADFYYQMEDKTTAWQFLLTQVRAHPHLPGLQKLLLWFGQTHTSQQAELQILADLVSQLGAGHFPYRCQSCGFTAHELDWYCPGCQHWESIVPVEPR